MKKALIIATIALLTGIGSAQANDDTRKTHGQHMHGPMHGDKNEAMHEHMKGPMPDMKGAFMATKEVDGYAVTFHVMRAAESMEKGGSHHLMVKVEKDGKLVQDIVANSKATHPDGQSESKMMMKMGDWYMAAYDLGHKGEHQLMVLFKTVDGAKHFTGVPYTASRVSE